MSPGSLVTRLHGLRAVPGAAADAQRRELLARAGRAVPRRAADVSALHDELLFLVAFPPSRATSARARRFLDHFDRWLRPLGSGVRALCDTGIAGTTTTATFPWSFAQWLRRHEAEVALVTDDASVTDRLEPLIRHRITPAEEDAWDSGTWTAKAFLHTRGGPAAFRWLVSPLDARQAALARAFELAEVPLRWSLGASPWSASRTRVTRPAPVTRQAFRKVPADAVRFIARPLRSVRRLSAREAAPWVDASIAALGARAREVTPTMDPNLAEVYLADLGEGASLCVLGTHRAIRCALEANYGYVMFSNGVPIGYGGVTPLANQANTGANLFPSFRGSEAPFLFAQSLRAFRHLFGIRRFIVNPYQFGAGNDEALVSGAWWFYDRLGFRSARAPLRTIASRERARIRTIPDHRTSRATLRRLAGADLVLDLGGGEVPIFAESHLVTLGRRVADHWGRSEPALSAGVLGRPRSAAWREGWRLLGPLVALIRPALAAWPPAARRELDAIIEAKGARQERRYVQLARRHALLWQSLDAAARRP